MNRNENRGKKLLPAVVCLLLSLTVLPQPADARDDYTTCVPNVSNGQYTTQCPHRLHNRNDISPQCVRQQNQNTCLNTMPVSNVVRISEDVCYRGEGWENNPRNHNGMDYAVAKGTPVVAAADGVAHVNTCLSGGGRTVYIYHKKAQPQGGGSIVPSSEESQYTTIYMHLASISVSEGTQVKKGQVIGTAGGSSCSNGKINEKGFPPHLHFEIRNGARLTGGTVLDPLCSNIQTLCEEQMVIGNQFFMGANIGNQSYNLEYLPDQTVSVNPSNYNPAQCRDCNKNPKGCKADYTELDDAGNTDTSKSALSGGTDEKGNCTLFFDENNLLRLSAMGESGGDYGIVNYYEAKKACYGNGAYAGKDYGGCSYGANQMACGAAAQTSESTLSNGKKGNFYKFMAALEKQLPELFAKLSNGNDLETTVKYACNDQYYPEENAAFREAWASLGNNADFMALQDAVNSNYSNAAQFRAKKAGISWDSLAPEVQMTFTAVAVASEKMLIKVYTELQQKYGKDLSKVSSADLITATNDLWAEVGYKSYLDKGQKATYEAAKRRAVKNNDLALTSLKIREAMNDPKNAGKTVDEISMELTGKKACAIDELPNSFFNTPSKSSATNSSVSANTVAAVAKSTKDCSVSKYRNSFKTCLFCGIFRTLFNTTSKMAGMAFETLSDSIAILVALGMALWLAFYVLKQISSFETKDPRNMMKEILNQAFVVIVVLLLLKMTSEDFMNLLLAPIFETGIDLAKMIISSSQGETCNAEATAGVITDGGLPSSMGVSILCVIDAIQNKILDIMAVGSSAICIGFFVESWKGLFLFPHLGYVISGMLLWIAALLLMVIYPWLLVDSLLQMCIAAVLLPPAIGSYAFKITRGMLAKKVWDTFMNAMFMFIFLSLVISILLMGIDSMMEEAFDRTVLLNAGENKTGWNVLIEGAKSIAWWGLNLLKIIFYLLLGWAVLGEASKFAGSFASGISTGGIGSNVGTLAMSGVRGAGIAAYKGAKKVSAPVGNLAKEKIGDAKRSIQSGIMKHRMNELKNKGTTDEDGNTTYRNMFGRKFTMNKDGTGYEYKNWLGRTRQKEIVTGENGRQINVKRKTNRKGITTSTYNDGFIKRTVETDKNGNEISSRSEMMTAAGRNLLNKDGTINSVAWNNISKNSAFSSDETNAALMEQLVRERMPGVSVANDPYSKTTGMTASTDENGNFVFTVHKVNADGTKVNMSMTMEKGSNRIRTDVEAVGAGGRALKYSSNGVVNKRSSYYYDKNGNIDESTVSNSYAFTEYYAGLNDKPMDSNGYLARGIPANGGGMLSNDEWEEFRQQVANDGHCRRRFGEFR